MLTSRERLDRCFRHKETDRPGIFIRGADIRNPRHDSYRRLREFVVEKCDLKNIIYLSQYVQTVHVIVDREAYNDDFERQIITMHTPAGDLYESLLVGLRGNPGYKEKHFIESAEDVEKYMSLPEERILLKAGDLLDSDQKLGDRGITVIDLGLNPAGSVVELMGSENFAFWSIENRERLYTLMELEMSKLSRKIKQLENKKTGLYFQMLGEEYITPPLHGAKDFYDFNVRYDKPLIDLIHESGSFIHVHCHGPLKNVLHYFRDMGVDVLHPVEAPSMGDVTAREAKQVFKGKVCIEGNIQIGDMYGSNPEKLAEMASELIKDVYYDHEGLIVCPSASPYVPEMSEKAYQNYMALITTVLNYK